MPAHVHCYRAYPEDFDRCLPDHPKPLEVGDSVEVEGHLYMALPMWRGMHLEVRRDRTGAQVATPAPTEPAGSLLTVDKTQDVGASA